jgi:mono/diheme cytochrome c family protein
MSTTIASLSLLLATYAAGAQPSLSKGAFTAEQAKNGETLYQAQCASCHGSDLRSTDPEAPDLTEGIFNSVGRAKP